jgi:RNA polymerase sigma factor (sigma-70 family)
MVQSKGGGVVRELETLWSTGTLTGASDAQLLERFALDRDATAELAFRELLERHAPMVMGVCRQIVRRPQDVDDAFQATFLVLVRKARSIQVRESLGPWLYKVAYRTAQRARVSAWRHASTGLENVESVGSAGDDGCALEAAPVLHGSADVDQDTTGGWQRLAVPQNLKMTPLATFESLAFIYEGKTIEEVAAFSAKHGEWQRVKLRAPVAGSLAPLIEKGFVLYQAGYIFYAFSAEKGAWAVLELPAEVKEKPRAQAHPDHILVQHGKRLYAFSLKQGKWSLPVEMDLPAAKSK